MTEPVKVSFQAEGVREIERAFDTIEKRIANFARLAERMKGGLFSGGATGGSGTTDRWEAGERSRLSKATSMARAAGKDQAREVDRTEREKTRAVEREEARQMRVRIRSSEMAGRYAAQQANAEIREGERAAKAIERARQREDKAASRASDKFFGGFGGAVAGAAGSAVNGVFGAGKSLVSSALSIGGGFDIAKTMRGTLDAERSAAQLSNSAHQEGKTGRMDPAEILRKATEVSLATGVDKNELIQGTQGFVAKSSDLPGGMANMEFFAKLAKGSGSKFGDITNAAGILRAQNTKLTEAEMQTTMLNIVEQGKAGAVEISDLARVAGKVTKTGAGYSMNQTEAQRQLLGLSQIAMKTSGSPDEAATVVSNFGDETYSKAKKLHAAGIQTTEANGFLKDPAQIIQQVFEKTGGNLGSIMNLGYGKRSMKLFESLAPTFREATDGLDPKTSAKEKNRIGAEAVLKQVTDLTGAKGSMESLEGDFKAVMASGAERFDMAMTRIKESVGAKLMPSLEGFIDKLPAFGPAAENAATALASLMPAIGGVLGTLGNVAQYSPIAAAALLGASQMTGAIGMLAKSLIIGMSLIDGVFASLKAERDKQRNQQYGDLKTGGNLIHGGATDENMDAAVQAREAIRARIDARNKMRGANKMDLGGISSKTGVSTADMGTALGDIGDRVGMAISGGKHGVLSAQLTDELQGAELDRLISQGTAARRNQRTMLAPGEHPDAELNPPGLGLGGGGPAFGGGAGLDKLGASAASVTAIIEKFGAALSAVPSPTRTGPITDRP